MSIEEVQAIRLAKAEFEKQKRLGKIPADTPTPTDEEILARILAAK
jgi:hypothetical protein